MKHLNLDDYPGITDDKAGNNLYYNINWDSTSGLWSSDDDNKARFKEVGFDLDPWELTLKNDNYDNQPPQGDFDVPKQLGDSILDISAGEPWR